ncbi:MAG: class I SAM-dependent methyltransferase [bacterium]|nr:class I SAM-dependent methyltransferase [bacterium]
MSNGDDQQHADEHDQRVKDDWDVLARYYDSRHGDAGNDWHRNLVLPTTMKLLGDIQGKRGIDLCCGSGVLARQLVELGAQVTGADQSEEFLSLAEQYDGSVDIEWLCFSLAEIADHVEPSSFDFVTCTMALMDIPASEDLFAAIAHCLKPAGVAVVVTMHPVFKNPSNLQFTVERELAGGDQREGIIISHYLTPMAQEVVGMPGQPQKQLNFHRPISHELNLAFDAGLVVDGFAEVTKSALEEAPTQHTDFYIPPSLEDEIPVLLGLRFRPAPW